MHKFYSFVSVSLLFVLIPVINVFARNIDSYAYEKTIITPNITHSTSVEIDLDETVLNNTNENLSNINIFDSENNEIPYRIYFRTPERIKNAKVLEVSSLKSGKKEYLVDNDVLTTFKFDPKESADGPASVLIDLGEPTRITRLNLLETSPKRTKQIKVSGGLKQDRLKTILSKRSANWQFDFNSPLIRFMKITFWGIGIKIDDIKLFQNSKATIYFDIEPQKRYKLFYGNPNANIIRYKRLNEKENTQKTLRLSKESANNRFPEDFDEDGINNSTDNCPFESNPMQFDSDKDTIGNDCDNAKNSKNANQYDTDFDNIGDIIDNCKLTHNPDQKDRDNDGYGDACDTAHAESNGFLKSISTLAWAIIFVIILGGSFYTLKKKNIILKK